MDFNGNILFTINRFRVVNGKKISTSMIPVYFHRGFKNGFVYVGRGNYTEKYDSMVICLMDLMMIIVF